MYKKLLLSFVCIFTATYSMQGPISFALGTLSATAATAAIYEVGKRNYIPRLTDYIKTGENTCIFSWDMKSFKGRTLKVGFDAWIWGASLFVSGFLWKLLSLFQKANTDFAFGAMVGSIALTSAWAQMISVKHNPFIWNNSSGHKEAVLIFTTS